MVWTGGPRSASPRPTSRPTRSDARLVALARLYDDYLHLVVRADSGIRTLARPARPAGLDRRAGLGHRDHRRTAAVGGRSGAAPEPASRPVSGLDDSAAALRDGRIEAFFFSGGLPVAAVKRLSEAVPLDLVRLGEYVVPLRNATASTTPSASCPSSTYGLRAGAEHRHPELPGGARRHAGGPRVRADAAALRRPAGSWPRPTRRARG